MNLGTITRRDAQRPVRIVVNNPSVSDLEEYFKLSGIHPLGLLWTHINDNDPFVNLFRNYTQRFAGNYYVDFSASEGDKRGNLHLVKPKFGSQLSRDMSCAICDCELNLKLVLPFNKYLLEEIYNKNYGLVKWVENKGILTTEYPSRLDYLGTTWRGHEIFRLRGAVYKHQKLHMETRMAAMDPWTSHLQNIEEAKQAAQEAGK